MTKLAQLIAIREGGWHIVRGRLDAIAGNLPARQHNPGDLRHSPHSQHPGDPNGIGVIDTDAHGFEDLERQIQIYASHNFTLEKAIYAWAPPNENDSESYLEFVLNGFGGRVGRQTLVSSILGIMA